MSGAINTVGKFFNSTAGRVAAGVATGGLSEVGRATAGTARRSGVSPEVSAGVGYLTGNTTTPMTEAFATPSTIAPGHTTPLVPSTTGGVAAASGSVAKTNDETQRALDDALTTATDTVTTTTDPYAEEDASRRRARESATRASGGQRRASQSLTYLGA